MDPSTESTMRADRDIELAVREGTMMIGHDGRVVQCTESTHDRLGLDATTLIGEFPLPHGWTMFDDDGNAVELDEHPALVALRTGERSERVLIYAPPGRQIRRRLRFLAIPVEDDADVAVDLVVSDHDRRRLSRQILESQETRFRTMTDMLAVAVWESSTQGEITYVNSKFEELTGLDASSAPDLPMLGLVHPDDVGVMGVTTATATEGQYRTEYRLRHVDGTSRWVTSKMSVLTDEAGNVSGYAGVIEDIDDLRRSERKARRLAEIVEAAVDAVMIFEQGRLVYVNGAASDLLARVDADFTEDLSTYNYSEKLLERITSIGSLVGDNSRWSGDIDFVDLEGVRGDLALMIDCTTEDGITRHVVMAHDIRERKMREAELSHNASHDRLTGLANRHRLHDVAVDADPDMAIGLLFVDLDDFKRINDVHGHRAGDRVLEVAAERVVSSVRDTDLVARVGGDEMVVWVSEPADLAELADRITRRISRAPVRLDGGEMCSISATVGGATGTAGTLDAVMARADGALYSAKRTGRGGFSLDVRSDSAVAETQVEDSFEVADRLIG
jgi:diguanylate cyclase (GGDEF)-like protein/PAS domain S-box-containing protein